MGIERHVLEGFTASPEPNEEHTVSSFEKKYDLSTLIKTVYKKEFGEDAEVPNEIRKKLTNHLTDMFEGNLAKKELLEEMIQDETVKYIKMFGKKGE